MFISHKFITNSIKIYHDFIIESKLLVWIKGRKLREIVLHIQNMQRFLLLDIVQVQIYKHNDSL